MIRRRFICGIMVICLLFSTILPSSAMAAETTHDMMPVRLTMYSNLTDDEYISGLYFDNYFLISLEDLCKISNWRVQAKDDNAVTLVYGEHTVIRECNIVFDQCILIEDFDEIHTESEMPVVILEDEIYVSAIHFLNYIGATVEIDQNAAAQFMVYKRYDIYDAILEAHYYNNNSLDDTYFFSWTETNLTEEELRKKLINAGLVALINRDSNVFRMAIDAEGIEQEAIEDALLSIIQNEGIDYPGESDKCSVLSIDWVSKDSSMAKDSFGFVDSWVELVSEAYDQSDDMMSEVSDTISSVSEAAGGINDVAKILASIEKFSNVTDTQRELLQGTILAHPKDSKTICNGWENVVSAAKSVDRKVQKSYSSGFQHAWEFVKSKCYDIVNDGLGTANPASIAWDGAMLVTKLLPFSSDMINRKTQLYNAYNCSMIQLIARELYCQSSFEWMKNAALANDPDAQKAAIDRVIKALILEYKSTLTTREYLIMSGFIDQDYTKYNEEKCRGLAGLLDRVEGCKNVSVCSIEHVDNEDFSWMKAYEIPFDELIDGHFNETESKGENDLMALAESYGTVAAFEYADYDGNGTSEAFAVIIDEYDTIIKTLFLSSAGIVTIMDKDLELAAYYSEGKHVLFCEEKGFFWCDMGGYGSEWSTLLYSVKNNQPYQLDLSRQIQGFYQEGDTFYTTENVFLPDGGHEYRNVELIYNAETQQFAKLSIDTETNIDSNTTKETEESAGYNVPEPYSTFLREEKYLDEVEGDNMQEYCLFDINQDGTDELILSGMSMGGYFYLVFVYDTNSDQLVLADFLSSFEPIEYSLDYKAIISGWRFMENAEYYYNYSVCQLDGCQLNYIFDYACSTAEEGYTDHEGNPLSDSEVEKYSANVSELTFLPLGKK